MAARDVGRSRGENVMGRGHLRENTRVVEVEKDVGLWLCIDYQGLNKRIVKNADPLPHEEDLFDQL